MEQQTPQLQRDKNYLLIIVLDVCREYIVKISRKTYKRLCDGLEDHGTTIDDKAISQGDCLNPTEHPTEAFGEVVLIIYLTR